ncbi:hypothetical protein R50345_13275 [Paenibacillus sp. FSL R5-0345]|uniref:hypothetical protein n=1 Tax=Paenibacillus sp. FSL R5-0345 TaxID=1536770 RepID=UPI0004F587C7|nr:hypothetical protein [Paenibacillus sp. FSL R5-0345]AIQ35496.1 hypothetical protein R50345_13275 [Paenibacillus sp. FSL R5-0345]
MSHVLHLMQVGLQEAYALAELVELDALSVVVRNKFRKYWVWQWPILYRPIKNIEGIYACYNRILKFSRLRRNVK